jgi:hypothetical protein
MSSSSFLPLLGLLVLPACPLADVEAEVPETCAIYHGLQIQAVAAGETSVTQRFVFDDLTAFGQLAELDASIRFTRAQVTATSGVADFSFVKTASVMIASGDHDATLPTLAAFGCESCRSSGAALEIASATSIDTKDYLSAGALIVDLDLQGTLPAVDWTMDVAVCVSGTGSYSVGL